MHKSFLELFDKHKESENPALKCGDRALTYAELYSRCLALASKLRALGVGAASTAPEHYDIFKPKAAEQSPWVVIIADRSVNAVIGVVATLMAGGAYVLFGSDAPEAYTDGILEDTAAAVVLRDGDFDAAGDSGDFTYTFPKENEIACAIFTSGSTGRPKGAVLEHRVINEMLSWQTEYMKPENWTATAMYAPLGFIAAIWEMFFPLANGLTLHILDENTRHDLFALETYIESNHISYMFLPPNIAEVFTQTYKGGSLKYLRVAGGRLKSCGQPRGYEILYHLGMAENGGSVTFKSIKKALRGDIPIGKPWNNTRITLDPDSGEMRIEGPSLFRGYLAQKDETRRKLGGGEYHSGDLARIDENGELVHMGRVDWSVKIRDMKVNPLQAESALCECEGVSECCVTAQELSGGMILIGWFAGGAEEASLRKSLSARLPEYMIPSVFVKLDKLPRNINGKTDRAALIYTPKENETASLADISETELRIAELFGQLLSIRSVGAGDSFLRLGGDSLKFIRLQAEIAREFSKNIPYTALYANPTPRKISALLQNKESLNHIPPAAPRSAYPLSEPMRQMWLLWRTGQDGGKYTMSVQCRFTGEIDKARLINAVGELVRRNAILRSRFEERSGEVLQIVEDGIAVTLTDTPRREFSLNAAPIFDVSLEGNVLNFTTHHIIADAIGKRVLMEDFWTLYDGGEPQSGAQAHDVTIWSRERDTVIDEKFWLQMFHDGVPELNLPTDYPRPDKLKSVAAESIFFSKAEVDALSEYAALHNATLFQLFLAGYAVLLSALSETDSVVIGVPFSGREHPDTARTIGMLVKTLPVRLDVSGMGLDEAVSYTNKRFLAVWEHQNMPITRLSQLIAVSRGASRNPFYDVMINYVPLPGSLPDVCGLRPEILRGEYPGAMFDLVLDLREETDGLSAVFTYAAQLFKPEVLRRWLEALGALVQGREMPPLFFSVPAVKEGVNKPDFDETAPQTDALLRAWEDVLGVANALPGDDFFSSGGTSLAAIRLEAALFEKGWLLSAADIFQNPRLSDMAALITPADDIDWEDEA